MAKEAAKKQKEKVPTPLKRDRQALERRQRNRSFKAAARTCIRSLEELIAKGDAASIKEKLSETFSVLDKGVKKGIYKANTANRTKARLAARTAVKAS